LIYLRESLVEKERRKEGIKREIERREKRREITFGAKTTR